MDYFAQSPVSYSPPSLPRPWRITSSSNSSSTLDRSPRPPPSSSAPWPNTTRRHRHSGAVENAMKLCRKLSEEATTAAIAGEEQGIIKNLQSSGWSYHTTTEGIRIFSKDTTETGMVRRQRSLGVREDESLPYFRGEGWIEGSWELEDLYATIVSIGARSVWDSRMDPTDSYVAAYLSDTDQLWKSHVRGELGVYRESAMVSSYALDPSSSETAYLISTSVEDPLILQRHSRTRIHLNGVCLRSLRRQPYFEQPPAQKLDVSPNPAPTRPGHRRTKSSAVMSPSSGHALLSPGIVPSMPLPTSDGLQPRSPFFGSSLAPPAPPPPPALPRSSSFESSSNTDSETRQQYVLPPNSLLNPVNGGGPKDASAVGPYDGLPGFSATSKATTQIPTIAPVHHNDRPGIHVSLILHVAPGLNLPQTTVNQLSLHLPLTINALGRYVLAHGFAPHLVRTPNLEVLEEAFDFAATTYRVVFRRAAPEGAADAEAEPSRIRFFGSTFAKGRFDIEVSSPSASYDPTWSIEYDVDPIVAPEIRRFSADHHAPSEGARPRNAGPRKSSLSIFGSPLTASIESPPRVTQSSNAARKDSGGHVDSNESIDPALLPGPLGACTLLLPPPPTVELWHVPITVSITKNASLVSRPLGKSLSRTLGRAADDHEGEGYDSIEEMLLATVVGSREWAERNLRNAQRVLRVVKEGEKAEEMEQDGKRSRAAEDGIGLGLRFAAQNRVVT